jgi:hypothetical protein
MITAPHIFRLPVFLPSYETNFLFIIGRQEDRKKGREIS